jgi:AmiR/NasT family two-component response regulator
VSDDELCNRAKAVLMGRMNLSEPQAHKLLQRRAQAARIKKVEIARRIVEAEELIYGPDDLKSDASGSAEK